MSSYISDFNNNIQSYFISSTYGNETLVNNSLQYLSLVTDQRVFDLSAYGNNVFFINLHKLMSSGTKKMSLLWSAVSVLEAATASCEETREALVKKFHYLPTLAKMLEETHNAEQQQRLLALIELLTYGVQLECHEPYVEALILKLLAVMEQGHGQKDKTELVTLALSILVNLCYMNLPMTYLLTKNISTSTFCGQIKQFGLVACKMYIILEKNDYMKEMDLHYWLKMSFKEVRNVLTSRNSIVLRHVVDYLRYIRQCNADEASKENRRSTVSIEDNFFRENLKEFLEDIEKHVSGQSKEKDVVHTRKKRRAEEKAVSNAAETDKDDCMDILFEILECIVSLESVGETFMNSMVEVALKWIRSRHSCSKAVDLLRAILEKLGKCEETSSSLATVADSCQNALAELKLIIKDNDDHKLLISICKLLTTMVKVQNTSHSDLDQSAEPIFRRIFGPILDGSQSFDYFLPDSEIRVYLWALHTFNEFANVAPTLWFAKIGNLLKQKQLHFLIAKGLTSGEEDLTEAMLHVSSSVDFPRREVSHMVSMLNAGWRNALSDSQKQKVASSNVSSFPNSAALSRDMLDRMNRTVSHIQDMASAGHINDVTKVELIEFYNLKINMESQMMGDLRTSLGSMSAQICTLMHQNQLLTAEINKVQRQNLPLVLKVSAQEAENRVLEKELNNIKSATASYDKKINQMKQDLSDYIRKASEKSQQCVALAKEVEKCRARNESYEKENTRLQHELVEMTKNRDDSRTLLKVSEDTCQKLSEQKEADKKMYETKIREREREISKRTDLIGQLEQQLSKRDSDLARQESELKDLLTQIATKEERIAQIEAELKESESIQKAIYSLMNKGKK
ncbi:uncharacterized protein LOC131682423 [Topomyia yanbarensis]|uniref:uncharacterized protein LOC131682423 n=1 Tax=Topomyia yanbarensis TaxID=2498891 RepID=UPI00273B6AAF|nr:uncharacterized protein LOC131682423 [Topomyia yanbarensis]